MQTTTHPFIGHFSRTSWVSWYQKSKTSLDLNEARDGGVLGWQWHQLDHMQTICTSLQTDDHISTSSLKFFRAGCSSWRPTYSVKALKARSDADNITINTGLLATGKFISGLCGELLRQQVSRLRLSTYWSFSWSISNCDMLKCGEDGKRGWEALI